MERLAGGKPLVSVVVVPVVTASTFCDGASVGTGAGGSVVSEPPAAVDDEVLTSNGDVVRIRAASPARSGRVAASDARSRVSEDNLYLPILS